MDTQQLTSYRANCHCGAITFTTTIPSLADHKVTSCDCSICTRNAYLFVYPEHKNVVFHSSEHLTSYAFGEKRLVHKFCNICGSSIVEADFQTDGKYFIGVNVRMFQDLDLKSVTLKYGSNKAPGVPYVVPKVPTTTTTTIPSDFTPHLANCHCGTIAFTFHTPSSPSPFTVAECNCSICTRNGYLLVYPKRQHVTFHTGFDGNDLGSYTFAGKLLEHKFCKICGSNLFIDFRGYPCIHGAGDRIGVNVRMVQDIELKDFEVEQIDGKSALLVYMVGSGDSKELDVKL